MASNAVRSVVFVIEECFSVTPPSTTIAPNYPTKEFREFKEFKDEDSLISLNSLNSLLSAASHRSLLSLLSLVGSEEILHYVQND